MTESTKQTLIKICNAVTTDVEKDMRESEGKPFNGKVVAELFGKQAAAIHSLSTILKMLIESE